MQLSEETETWKAEVNTFWELDSLRRWMERLSEAEVEGEKEVLEMLDGVILPVGTKSGDIEFFMSWELTNSERER